jgi:hypothetical protein
LQQLRFGGRGITAQKNVNFSPESSATALRELLGASAKKLAEYALLDVLVLPNGGCECVDQLLGELRVRCEVLELLDLLVGK